METEPILVEVLATAFSLDELVFVAERLGMNATEHLAPHDTPRTFALKLHHYFESRGQLAALEAEVHRERPHLSWRSPDGRGAVGQPARLHNVPELPKYVLPREEEVAALRRLLLAEETATVGIVGARQANKRVVGVRGMGGLGKTVLATVLAHDETLRAHFTDGIFWLTVGEGASEASLLSHQTALAKALGDSAAAFTDLRAGKLRLRELLAKRCCLLVLDDVWQSKDAEPFKALGPRGRLLLTTRDAQVLNQLDAQPYDLALLGEAQALGLLAWWAKQEPGSLPAEAPAIAKECGYLPLALAMVGALIGDEVDTWASALQKLRARDLKAVAREVGEDYAYPSLWRAIEVSVEALPPDLRERYADFALFPADTPIPPAVLHTLWEHEGLPSHRVTNALNTLANRSLLRKDDAGCLTLHDLQLDFVREQAANLPALHQRLLDAYAARCPDGWANGPDDGYFFQQLPYHLMEAERADELETLLLDYRWLRARLHATDIFTLLGDFERLPLPLPHYHPTDFTSPGRPIHALSALQDSLQKSAHVLARDKSQLPAHLLGRLLDEPLPPLRPLLDQAIQDPSSTPWLRPLTASLEHPSGPLLRTLGDGRWVNAVALSGDGQRVVSTSDHGTLKVWDVATGRELHSLVGHEGEVNAVALSQDGRVAVSASDDGALKVWDLDKERERHTLTGHAGRVNAVAMSGDGQLIVSISSDGMLRVWEAETGRNLCTVAGHAQGVKAVAMSGDGHLMVGVAADGTIRLREVATGHINQTLVAWSSPHPYNRVWNVVDVALSWDGRWVGTASADGTMKVWEVATGQISYALRVRPETLECIALSGDGRLVMSALSNGTIKVWEVKTGRLYHTLSEHGDVVRRIAFSKDGRLAVSTSSNGTIKVWDMRFRHARPLIEGGQVMAVALNRDGRLALSASEDGTLTMWEVGGGSHIITKFSREIVSVALNELGQRAISALSEGALEVWDVKMGLLHRTLTEPVDSMMVVAFSGYGRFAVSMLDHDRFKIWEIDSGRELRTLGGYGWILSVIQLEDRWMAATRLDDGSLKVWEVGTGQELCTLVGHERWVNAVALSADGRLAVSASDDRTLKVWEVETGACLATFEGESAMTCCAFAPPFIVAGGQSGRVHFLRLMNGGE